jgi:hypothetical protein
MKAGTPAKCDYEYVRAGTCNVFVAVEPKGGQRIAELTERRTTPEFVGFVQRLLKHTYASARKVHLVLDNLNTHFRSCFEQELGGTRARALLRRVQFHYTPKHASWLNMAEIEISILERQCLARRLADQASARARSEGLAASAQCRKTRHRLDLHASGCRSKAHASLGCVINVSLH